MIGTLLIVFLFVGLYQYGRDKEKAKKEAKEDAWRKQLLDTINSTHQKPKPTPKPYFPDDDPYWQPEGIPKTPRPSAGPAGATARSADHPLAN